MFYAVLSAVNTLLCRRQLQLRRCHRKGTDTLHYYVTDATDQVLTPTHRRQRIGLTLEQLLIWLEQSSDHVLSHEAFMLRRKFSGAR
ncbi:MAG TPA: hypothetical protein VFM32_11325 [Spongiibacteraceae bacterium]|nr:hypothetical protein [Spongiibacteraceae bacterium]